MWKLRLTLDNSATISTFERYHAALLSQGPRYLCIADIGQGLQFLKRSWLHTALSLKKNIPAFHWRLIVWKCVLNIPCIIIVLYVDLSLMYWPCFRKLNQASFELQTKPFFVLDLLTYSMVQSHSWEANRFAASQEIPRISRNPKVHYRTQQASTTCLYPGPA